MEMTVNVTTKNELNQIMNAIDTKLSFCKFIMIKSSFLIVIKPIEYAGDTIVLNQYGFWVPKRFEHIHHNDIFTCRKNANIKSREDIFVLLDEKPSDNSKVCTININMTDEEPKMFVNKMDKIVWVYWKGFRH